MGRKSPDRKKESQDRKKESQDRKKQANPGRFPGTETSRDQNQSHVTSLCRETSLGLIVRMTENCYWLPPDITSPRVLLNKQYSLTFPDPRQQAFVSKDQLEDISRS